MSFTAWYYPLFLTLVAALFWLLPRRGRWLLLLLASYVFYGYWDIRFLALLGASTVMDFLCGQAIGGQRNSIFRVAILASLPVLWFALVGLFGWQAPSPHFLIIAIAAAASFALLYWLLWQGNEAGRARRFLCLQIAYNLGLLFFFKYCNFFVDSAKAVLSQLGFGLDFYLLDILLPVGISFYTFQSIAYAVDIYRGKQQPEQELLLFAAFIAFFPQLVAGPIERASHLLPQLRESPRFEVRWLHEGLVLLLVGYFKKIFVANHCAMVADYFFKGSGQTSTSWVLLGTLAFAFQIYGDFSGYTDIARGSARFFGVRLSQNFRFPYAAQSPSDFWQRWHVSLSSWIRDYLYIPLGGNRYGARATIRNHYISMILAGLWHGAAWNFLLWGAYHASLLSAYRALPGLARFADSKTRVRWLAIALMFGLTLLGWLIFRAPSLQFLINAGQSLVGMHAAGEALSTQGPAIWVALHVAPLLVLQWFTRRAQDESQLQARAWGWRALDYTVMLLLIASSLSVDQEFIYFQF